jgi:TIGR03009 family protein
MARFLLSIAVSGWLAGGVWAQNRQASWADQPQAPAAGQNARPSVPKPDQPVYPPTQPGFERRPATAAGQASASAPGQAPRLPPPFQLTPQEQTWLDQVLTAWEKENQKIKTFDCKFRRWEYAPSLARTKEEADNAAHVDLGIIKYATPDKGKYQVFSTIQFLPDGTEKEVPIEANRAELYICDGKAVYVYDPVKKCRHEHQLPPELQGKAIVDSPMPFIFGAEAKKLRERYYMRIVPPSADAKNQIWIEAYPIFQPDAANFHHCLLILETPKLQPMAMMMVLPGGKNRSSYKFYDVVVNDSWKLFKSNPFVAYTPRGWEKEVHPPQSATAPKPPPGLR